MELFPERLVADLGRLPGANHCYLKQICAPDGSLVRARLQARVDALAPPVQARAAELLSSLDNRRFFQGFAEVATLAALRPAGWDAVGLAQPGPRVEIARGDGAPALLSVLAFLHQTRPGGEDDTKRRLADALGRVNARQRFAVLVRRWLPHDFDPEPVRRAVELWLGQVQSGSWRDRYASYDDEHVSLEFCLTGEKAKAGQSPVALVLGPYYAHRTMEVLEPRIVAELDRHRASPMRDRALLVSCVADQPWAVTDGYLRDFLYGRPRRASFPDGELEFSGAASVCVFRDPLYRAVSGVLLVDRRPAEGARLRVRAFLNPWAARPLRAADVGVRCLAEDPEATARARAAGCPDAKVLTWQGPEAPEVDL